MGPRPWSIHFVCPNDFLTTLSISLYLSLHLLTALHRTHTQPISNPLETELQKFSLVTKSCVCMRCCLRLVTKKLLILPSLSLSRSRFVLHWIQILEMNCHRICTFHHWTCSLAIHRGLVYRLKYSHNIWFRYTSTQNSECMHICARSNNNTNKLWMYKYNAHEIEENIFLSIQNASFFSFNNVCIGFQYIFSVSSVTTLPLSSHDVSIESQTEHLNHIQVECCCCCHHHRRHLFGMGV